MVVHLGSLRKPVNTLSNAALISNSSSAIEFARGPEYICADLLSMAPAIIHAALDPWLHFCYRAHSDPPWLAILRFTLLFFESCLVSM